MQLFWPEQSWTQTLTEFGAGERVVAYPPGPEVVEGESAEMADAVETTDPTTLRLGS